MIKLKISYDNLNHINLEITGHALYDKKGKDIVCAGVSAIVFGCMNALSIQSPDEVEIEKNKNSILIKQNLCSTEKSKIILETLIISIQCIQENYKNYIKIEREK